MAITYTITVNDKGVNERLIIGAHLFERDYERQPFGLCSNDDDFYEQAAAIGLPEEITDDIFSTFDASTLVLDLSDTHRKLEEI